MNGFRVSNAAMNDLREVAAYTERTWGSQQRRDYLSRIDETFHLLANNPSLGSHCDYIAADLRKHPCGSHVIYYELDATGIFVVRVLHRKMDVSAEID
ncbi:MAG: type II toxin-antitoxin system RelE/ParE family toxin [Pseudomonadota bacterium]|nr:type II toxin-antitoxin system RelE/ParE family toxin [Pseudomonadota bacterium]MEC8525392.1 type II toxin-antitoxin system RelE/ParE family toxin [Pseudomonadota bacterium]